MESELQLIKQFEADSNWLKTNKDELREEYTNKFVAVKDEHVAGSNSDLKVLIKELKKNKINPAFVVIEFITKDRIITIY
ncbi:MAG: DUF5678 domain-containing protein [Candidatus Aenigmatarchaeota archaeon]